MWLLTIFLTEFSPNPVAPQMEWVELYNNSQDSVDIGGFSIRDSTTSNKQILSGAIPPQSYFTFSFDRSFLNNTTADIIRLFDQDNNLIDSQSSKNIPSGLSFSRQADGTWCPSDISPNLPNGTCKDSFLFSNTPTSVPYISLKITNLNADTETIEIDNPNNFSVNLFDWRVADNSGSLRKLSCITVDSNSTCNATFSSGYLNNDSDKLTLLDPLKREISIYEYDNPKKVSPKTPTKIPTQKLINVIEKQKTIYISSPSSSSVAINQSSPIRNYLSIILMLLGSVFILSPLVFHAKFNKK
ncbi:MAG: lamin tail domain-containing protein [Candidatus Shapirobacteria bacterium]